MPIEHVIHSCPVQSCAGIVALDDAENNSADYWNVWESAQPGDLLKIFWEPGITDIQKSRNLFIVDLVDTELLDQQYPEHKGHFGGNAVDVKEYYWDESIDNTKKAVVVDWYYKIRRGGRTLLHYVKFVNDILLYASENEPEYADRGYYDHGMYPVVFDTLFPEKGTPVGFGYVAVCKDPQMYIDKLSANILDKKHAHYLQLVFNLLRKRRKLVIQIKLFLICASATKNFCVLTCLIKVF